MVVVVMVVMVMSGRIVRTVAGLGDTRPADAHCQCRKRCSDQSNGPRHGRCPSWLVT
jgi:hypothetical protein